MASSTRRGKSCVAFGCGNTHLDGVSLHTFPFSKPALCRLWTKFVQTKRHKWDGPTKHSVLCSEHFSPGCYPVQYAMMDSMQCTPPKRRTLTKDAVPTIHSNTTKSTESEARENINRLKFEGSSASFIPKRPRTAFSKRENAREVSGKSLTMVKETKMDRIKEREKIAAMLKKAVLSLCQEKYQNPIEVDALICVAITPTDNHVVKIHETIGNFKDQTSGEVSVQDANDGQDTCSVSSTWSTVQNSNPKANLTIYGGGTDSTTWQANENPNPKNLSVVSTSNSSDQGQIYDKVNRYLSTDVLRKGGVENSAVSAQPMELVAVASGLATPNNIASTLVYPISTISKKVPIAENSVCRKRKLDHGEIKRSLLTQEDDESQNYAMIKEQSEDRQYHQKVSEKEHDFINNAESNSSQTSGEEALPGGILIKEEPLWTNDTESIWPRENQKNGSEVDYSKNSSLSNSPKHYLQSQPESPEVPLEMSVTSIKEEPQDSDPGEPEMEIDTDIDTSQLENDQGRTADNSFSVTGITPNSGPSKILKGNPLVETYKISVPIDRFSNDSKEGISLLMSQSSSQEDSSQLMYQLPFV